MPGSRSRRGPGASIREVDPDFLVPGAQEESILDVRGGDLLRSREVDDVAELGEEVELPDPVVAHDEDVDVMVPDVDGLLLPIVLRDHQIDVADRLDDRAAVLVAG